MLIQHSETDVSAVCVCIGTHTGFFKTCTCVQTGKPIYRKSADQNPSMGYTAKTFLEAAL